MRRQERQIRTEPSKLTDIDLSGLQLGERLTVYRGSDAYITGPQAAGLVGEAIVSEVTHKRALLNLNSTMYRLRFSDNRICRIPNGEPTMMYVHARGGRPTVTGYFTDDEYVLVKTLLEEEAYNPKSAKTRRSALRALERMSYHDRLCADGGR